LSETGHSGIGHRIVLHVSHTGMLFSLATFRHVQRFLQTGEF
jgi:hypothetical protein